MTANEDDAADRARREARAAGVEVGRILRATPPSRLQDLAFFLMVWVPVTEYPAMLLDLRAGGFGPSDGIAKPAAKPGIVPTDTTGQPE